MVPEHKNTTSRSKFKHFSAFGLSQVLVGTDSFSLES
jgi:hypothetical protein